MGFDAEAAQLALEHTGSPEAAALFLLQQVTPAASEPSPPPPPPETEFDALCSSMASARASQALGAGALDAAAELVAGLTADPRDSRLSVVQVSSGRFAALGQLADGAGTRFLQELGYAKDRGFWLLRGGRGADPALLWMAQQAIERARAGFGFRLAEALAASTESLYHDGEMARSQLHHKPVAPVPTGAAPKTRIFLRVMDSTGSSEVLRFERFFAPDDSLSDLVHVLGTLPDHQVPPSHSWELVESTGGAAPFWWCHGWELTDVTMRPPRKLTKGDATRTLQALELWPSATVVVRPLASPGAPTPAVRSAAAATVEARAPGGGHYLGGRPKPSELIASVTRRFDGRTPTDQGRKHYPIQSSASSATAQELIDMGFDATAVANALRQCGGAKDKAVELLLR